MNRTPAELSQIVGIDQNELLKMTRIFKEHLSAGANPAKGHSRTYTESDLLVLVYVGMHWEEEQDIGNIQCGLNQGFHLDDDCRRFSYLNSPLFQEPPEDLDETWTRGFMLAGGRVDDYLELARAYREIAEELTVRALSNNQAREWAFPVMYAYRHALELYLKIVGEIDETTHSLRRCLNLVEKRHGKNVPPQVRCWIEEFDKFDPDGTAFRYADDSANTLRYTEYWIDLHQFKFVMKEIFEKLDNAVRRLKTKGRPVKKRQRVPAGVCHFHVPGEAARREYAVYIIVVRNRTSDAVSFYIGKTGDNRDGNNPVISRAGNHLSFNKIHSQVRNKVVNPQNHDFDIFSISFGPYCSPKVSRDGIDLINEMERQLNTLAQNEFGASAVLNPFQGKGHVKKTERQKRAALATAERLGRLQNLISAVKVFMNP